MSFTEDEDEGETECFIFEEDPLEQKPVGFREKNEITTHLSNFVNEAIVTGESVKSQETTS